MSDADRSTAPTKQRSLSTRNIVVLVTAIVLVVAVAALNLIHVPVAILRPGPVTNTLGKVDGKPVIEVQGADTYPTTGSLDFTTVSMAGGPQYPVSVMQWIRAKFDDHAQIDPEDKWFPKGITSQQVQQQNTAEMTNSQQTAEVVAMRAAGVKVPETITVAQLQPGAAAEGQLKQGDTLVKVNGVAVQNLQSVADAMDSVKSGSKVAVTVNRGGKQQQLQVPTATGPEGRAVFGIAITPNYKFPYQVKVNAGDVGGPSAGTMFSLAIYDLITPGALTGGKKIAGTGTMSEDGSVGPIGGIAQKMQGAKDAGAQFFLAPVSDCSDAKGNIPKGLTVVKVETFNDALTAVKQIGTGKTTGFPSC
ncbi:YlbL family protein [Flexivirga meconopsidis]|uniref:YlbL family protein n=1 Tax=Flexivirga meconopsidis TaxID=2977121 RepID=UPI00223F0237